MQLEQFAVPYGRIEDVPEPLLDRAGHFMVWAVPRPVRSGRYSRILMDVTEFWMLQGAPAVVVPNAMARAYGTSRRSICRMLRVLKDHGALIQVGRTDTGSPIFLPNLDLTEEHYLQSKRDLEIEMAEYDRLEREDARGEA